MTSPLAVTIGDPAGIGPEIILKTLARLPNGSPDVVVYGARNVLDWTARRIPGLGPFDGPVVDVLGAGRPDLDFDFGTPTPSCATLQHAALLAAIDDALAGRVAGIVTAPWTKHILPLAGLPPTGHTEVLARRCGVDQPTMMLCGDTLRVALATVHVPLHRVAEVLDADTIVTHLKTLDLELKRRFAIESPRLAVCGLNPHAGEGGLMGDEEQRIIGPALQRARRAGLDVEGPWAADTLFARAVRTHPYDAILAMYHDQGLIPLKLWHFGQSANLTLGLPIIRTSVDHGTAYDIAGQGRADTSSLEYALALARAMADS